jgi:hypothetical protein
MSYQPVANQNTELAAIYRMVVDESYRDLRNVPHMHPDFIADALNSISQKKKRLDSPLLLGELFPHLVAHGLSMPDGERRRLAAAWIAPMATSR